MERVAAAAKVLLTFGVALGMRHRFHGPPVDYAGLAAAAAASWVGVPGPGEPVLIAAGVFAARHKLDIASVLLIAWAGATAGGVAGWVIGMRAGRAVLSGRGPLQRLRQATLKRGDEVFARHTVIAVLLVPSWISGIHRVAAGVYLVTNAFGAAIWAVGIGLGAFLVGPTVVDVVEDLGWVTAAAIAVLIAAGVGGELLRRRRRRARSQQPS